MICSLSLDKFDEKLDDFVMSLTSFSSLCSELRREAIGRGGERETEREGRGRS